MRTVAQYSFAGATSTSAEAGELYRLSYQAVEAWIVSKGKADPATKTLQLQTGEVADYGNTASHM